MTAHSERGEKTRLEILRAAGDLFHARGVAATSPDDVIEASGTGKGQFYHYFKSKDGLVHAVLQNYVDQIRAGQNPAYFDIKTWSDLERFFLIHVELQKSFKMTRSCLFGTIGNGVTDKDELVRQDLNLIFEIMKNNLATFFKIEKTLGKLSAMAHEGQLADFCIATVQGAMLMGKIRRSAQSVEATIEASLHFLRSLIVAPNQPGQRADGSSLDETLER